MTECRLQNLLGPKSEVIHLLFWYAVRQERCGDTGLFNAILDLTKQGFDGSSSHELLWHLSVSKMCTYGSPRAAVLAGPNINWGQEQSVDAQGLIFKWAAGISVTPHTEEVAGSVVDTLLQIAANPHLRPFIPPDAWSWLNNRPSLPSACRGLSSGCDRDIVRTIRVLDDTRILTSYLITIWSEWKLIDYDDFVEIQMSVREDFKGIGVGCHRAELIQRLDSILGELYRRSRRLRNVTLEDRLWREKVGHSSRVMEGQYREFKRVLQEMEQKGNEILNRTPPDFIFLSLLTLTDLHRIPLDLHVCPAFPVFMTWRLGRLTLFEINRLICSRYIPLLSPCALLIDLEQSQFYLDMYHSGSLGAPVRKPVTIFFSPCPRVFCLRAHSFCIVLVKHNSLCLSSLSQQIIYRTMDK